jgi:hypothetical protein
MAKGSQELEQEFIASAREKTGHDLAEWLDMIKRAGLDAKQNTIIKWIKDEHKLNHMQATFLAGIYLNDGKPVFDYEVLFKNLFTGKKALLPLYEGLKTGIQLRLSTVEFIPTKTYVSVEDRRVFGCVTPTRSSLRLGLDLGDTPFDGIVQKAKRLGAMPNVSHMIEISRPDDISAAVFDYTEKAYQRTHS